MVCLINRGRFPMIKAIINVSPSPGCIVLVNVEVVLVVVLVVVLLIIAPIEASVPTWMSCLSDSSGGPADSEEGWVWKRGQRSFSHRIRVGSSGVSTGLRGLRGVSWCWRGNYIKVLLLLLLHRTTPAAKPLTLTGNVSGRWIAALRARSIRFIR